jgi:hypothetical protein
MRRNLIGVAVVVLIAAVVLGIRFSGSRHETRATLEQALASLPPGTTATHGETDYNPITDTLTIHDLALSRDGRKVGSAGLVVAKGARIEALRAVFDPDAYPDGKPAWSDRRSLLGHLDVQSLRIEAATPDGSPLLIRHAVVDGLSGRPFIRPPTPPNRSAADFQADVALALAVGLVEVDGVDMTREGQGHAGVSSIGLTDYDGGKLSSLHIDGIEISGLPGGRQKVSFSLAKIAITGTDLRPVVGALGASAGLDPAARRRAIAGAYSASQVGQFDVDGMALKIAPGPRVELASFRSQGSRQADGSATGSAALRGLSVAADDSPMPDQAHAMMQRFGSDRVVLDEDTEAGWTEATKHLELSRLDLSARDLGVLHVTASLGGIDRAGLNATDPAARRAAFMGVVVSHAALWFDDKSLVGRVIGVLAMQQNATPEQVRAEAAMPLAGLSMLLPDEPDAAAQVSAFLDHPHSLRISLDPPAPVSLGAVAAAPMTERAHMLGLKITGN